MDDKKEKLRQLQITIDKLEKNYGKGKLLVVSENQVNDDEFRKRRYIYKLRSEWVHFIYYSKSTDLWSKEEFEKFLNNREELLNTSYRISEHGTAYYAGQNDDSETIKRNTNFFDKLKDLYDQRFNKIEIDEPEDHTRYSKNQIFYLLTKLGLFNTPEFNKLIVKQEDKQKVVSKILGCAERTSKGLLNGEEKYTATPENIEIVDKFLKSISKEK